MAIAPVTVTVDFNDFLGEDFDPATARLVLATNVASGWIVDTTTGGTFRVGGARITPSDAGVATASVLPSGATGLEPGEYQIRFIIEATNAVTRKKASFDLGWYTITATCNLKDEVDEQYVAPTYMTTAQATLQEYVDQGEDIRDETQAIRDGIVGDLGTTDSQTATLIGSPGSLTETALSASTGRRLSAINAPYNVPTDGTTDATTALASWLAALDSETQGVLAPGLYKTTGPLTIPAGVHVDLDGVTIETTSTGNAINLSDGSRVRGSWTLRSTVPYTGTNSRTGVSAVGKSEFSIGDVAVEDFGRFGVVFNDCSKFSVGHLTITGTGTKDDGASGWEGDGLWITEDSHDFTVTGVVARDNGRHGVFCWSDGTQASARDFTIGDISAHDNGDIGVCLTNIKDYAIGVISANRNGDNGGPFGGQGVQVSGDVADATRFGQGSITGVNASENYENGLEVNSISNVAIAGVTGLRNTWSGLALNNSVDLTVGVVNAIDNGTEGVSIDGTDGFVVTGITAHRNALEGVCVKGGSTHGEIGFIRADDNSQGTAGRAGVLVAGATGVRVSTVEARDTQGVPTQTYGVRLFAGSDVHVRQVRGSGNITKLIEVDGGATNWSIDGQNSATTPTLTAGKTGTVGNAPRYYKVDSETVAIEGEFSQDNVSVTSDTIFTLPVGFRPAYKQTFIVATYAGGWTFSIIEIRTDGTVFWANAGLNRAVMFGRLVFRLGQVGY